MVVTDERKFTVVLPEGNQGFTMDEILRRANERNYKFWIIGSQTPTNFGAIVAGLEKEYPCDSRNLIGPFDSYMEAFQTLTPNGRMRQRTHFQYSQPWRIFINFLCALALDIKTGRRQA